VCATCRRTTEGFERCLQCNRHFQVFGQELADEVVPISLAFKGKQLAHVLWQYKNSGSEAVRRRFTDELLTVLANFLRQHAACLGDFDLVTIVPSSQGRTSPLVDVLGRRLGLTSRRFTEVLSTNGENTRRMRPELYAVSSDVRSRRVLLVDDTWTSGASLQSAAVALKRAGAARVVGLVIGRHLDEPEPAASAPFDWTACCLCQQV
jgi:predicted amidophosphoribosyltransferase